MKSTDILENIINDINKILPFPMEDNDKIDIYPDGSLHQEYYYNISEAIKFDKKIFDISISRISLTYDIDAAIDIIAKNYTNDEYDVNIFISDPDLDNDDDFKMRVSIFVDLIEEDEEEYDKE